MTDKSIVGDFKMQGVDTGGWEYDGNVMITKDDDSYILSWTYCNGYKISGTAYIENDLLQVEFVQGKYTTQKQYTIDDDKLVLQGHGSVEAQTIYRKLAVY